MPEEERSTGDVTRDVISQRVYSAIEESGADVLSWQPITTDEAWQEVAAPLGWDDFDRNSLPGGLIVRPIKNKFSQEVIAVAFVGLKDLSRPKDWKIGAIGFKGGMITLGNFSNKI